MINCVERKISPEIKNVLISILIVSSVVFYLYWGKFSGNITGFFRIGSILSLSPYLNPDQTLIFKGEIGYDGQQFLSLALDLGLQNPETLTALDHPSYRYRRILYPLLGHLLGMGNPSLIPYALVAINAIAIVLLVWMIGRYFKFFDKPQKQALFLLCIPGVWIVLSLSTADLLSALFLVTALLGYAQRKPWLTAIALSLGGLTRETMLLTWIAIGVASLWERRQEMFIGLFIAPIPIFLWNLYVFNRHLPGHSGIGANFGWPLLGILQKVTTLLQNGLTAKNLFEGFLFGLLLAIVTALFWLYSQNPPSNRAIFLCSLLASILLIFSRTTILGYYLDFSRVYLDLFLLFLLVIPLNTVFIKKRLFILSGIGSFIFLSFHS